MTVCNHGSYHSVELRGGECWIKREGVGSQVLGWETEKLCEKSSAEMKLTKLESGCGRTFLSFTFKFYSCSRLPLRLPPPCLSCMYGRPFWLQQSASQLVSTASAAHDFPWLLLLFVPQFMLPAGDAWQEERRRLRRQASVDNTGIYQQ